MALLARTTCPLQSSARIRFEPLLTKSNLSTGSIPSPRDARIVTEDTNRLAVVSEGENFSVARAVRTGCTCDEERHEPSPPRRFSTTRRLFARNILKEGGHFLDVVRNDQRVRLAGRSEGLVTPGTQLCKIVPLSDFLPNRALIADVLHKCCRSI